MLVFDPQTRTVSRFTLTRGLLNEGYYEMARDELVAQVARDLGSLSAEQVEKIRALPIAGMDKLEAALWDLETMSELDEFLARHG